MYASIVSQIRPFVDADFSETGSEAEPEAGSPQFWARTINVDLPRTYPVLAFFHKGGPLCGPLHEVLLAYAVFRPEIGYVCTKHEPYQLDNVVLQVQGAVTVLAVCRCSIH